MIAYRARRVGFDSEGNLLPYNAWPFSTNASPSYANFGTGHSGVLYPVGMQVALRKRGTDFLKVSPRADDVWLHNTSVREGFPTRLVETASVAFDSLPMSQRDALKHTNVASGMNDPQIEATYAGDIVSMLRDAAVAEESE